MVPAVLFIKERARRRGVSSVPSLLMIAGVVIGAAATSATPASASERHKLLVVSVDGLDWRYLRDRDALGLSIPNLRTVMGRGTVADGVVGIWPTITWPSHTSIITGVRPDQHGILGNAERGAPFSQSYWSVKALQARTLWQCASDAGLTTAAVTWPATVNAKITYNLPEAAMRRNGGSMDLESVAATATPGLVEAITRLYPSFPQQWVDDRTRTQAVLYLLRTKQPDLILAHLVDLDSEEHDQGPFAANAKAILERTDELLGQMLAALPGGYDLVVTSDHGFERIDKIANLIVLLRQAGVQGDVLPMGGIAVTSDPGVAGFLRGLSRRGDADIGREIPPAELQEYAPTLKDVSAAFEPADHVLFGRATSGPYETPPHEKGEHGFWPTRHDYRSVFILYGPGVAAGVSPPLKMLSLNSKLAGVLGIACTP